MKYTAGEAKRTAVARALVQASAEFLLSTHYFLQLTKERMIQGLMGFRKKPDYHFRITGWGGVGRH